MIPDREKYVNLEDVKITLHNTDSLGKAAWDVISLPYIVPPKWIPVSERLPGNINRVLIAKRISADITVVDIGRYLDHEKTWYSKDFEVVDVVAWMPRPIPYEEAK